MRVVNGKWHMVVHTKSFFKDIGSNSTASTDQPQIHFLTLTVSFTAYFVPVHYSFLTCIVTNENAALPSPAAATEASQAHPSSSEPRSMHQQVVQKLSALYEGLKSGGKWWKVAKSGQKWCKLPLSTSCTS
jgi:hypothetical protein